MAGEVSDKEMDAIMRRQFAPDRAEAKCDRCEPNEISAYLEGALSAKRTADFEAHMLACRECRQAVIALNRLPLATEEASPVPQVQDPASTVAAPGFGQRVKEFFGLGAAGSAWRPAVAFAMLLLLVGVPVLLFVRQQQPAERLVAQPQPEPLEDAPALRAIPAAPPAPQENLATSPAPKADAPLASPTLQPPIAPAGQKTTGPAQPQDLAKAERAEPTADAVALQQADEAALVNWSVAVTATPAPAEVDQLSSATYAAGERRSDNRPAAAAPSPPPPPPPARAEAAREAAPEKEAERNEKKARQQKQAAPAEALTAYQNQVSQLLARRFNQLVARTTATDGVSLRLRVASNGAVTSLRGGPISAADIIQRSSDQAVNAAAVMAVTQGPLPAFPAGIDQRPIILTVQFKPQTD